jgi:hypothetical protein
MSLGSNLWIFWGVNHLFLFLKTCDATCLALTLDLLTLVLTFLRAPLSLWAFKLICFNLKPASNDQQ